MCPPGGQQTRVGFEVPGDREHPRGHRNQKKAKKAHPGKVWGPAGAQQSMSDKPRPQLGGWKGGAAEACWAQKGVLNSVEFPPSGSRKAWRICFANT